MRRGSNTTAKKAILQNASGDDEIDRRILQQRNGTFASTQAGLEFEQQFWQGKKGPELEGIGCGKATFSSPWIPSRYPSPSETRIVIEAGEGGPGNGSIRLIGPRGYWPGPPKFADASFLVPFAHIEQVIALPYVMDYKSNPRAGGFPFVLIPSATIGSFPLRRFPRFISFACPQRADISLSALKRALNEQLARFHKAVIDLTLDSCICSKAVVKMSQTDKQPLAEGSLYFLETGILFLAPSTRMNLYLPRTSLLVVATVVIRDKAQRVDANAEIPVVAFDLYLPGNTAANDLNSPLWFCRLPFRYLEAVQAYFEAREAQVKRLEQIHNDYVNGDFKN
ncbi:hypothetical protein OQA88_8465 [Cercophora sp. LCS_1]